MNTHAHQHWQAQRFSAFILACGLPWLVFFMYGIGQADYAEAISYFSHPFQSSILLFVLWAAIYHAYLGVRVVLEDYIHIASIRLTVLVFLKGLSLFLCLFSLICLIKLLTVGNHS